MREPVRVVVPVEGMTCTACVSHVTRALRRLEGVESVKVNLGADSATLAFDPGRTSLAAIAAAVEGAGYRTRPEDAVPAPERPARRGLPGWLRRR